MQFQNHIAEIKKVRDAASVEGVAYLFRSRLKRLILNLNRSVAGECGLEIPILPGELIIHGHVSETIRRVNYHCNRLQEIANTICQPSEPLDSRWTRMWNSAMCHVDALDELIHAEISQN